MDKEKNRLSNQDFNLGSKMQKSQTSPFVKTAFPHADISQAISFLLHLLTFSLVNVK